MCQEAGKCDIAQKKSYCFECNQEGPTLRSVLVVARLLARTTENEDDGGMCKTLNVRPFTIKLHHLTGQKVGECLLHCGRFAKVT